MDNPGQMLPPTPYRTVKQYVISVRVKPNNHSISANTMEALDKATMRDVAYLLSHMEDIVNNALPGDYYIKVEEA